MYFDVLLYKVPLSVWSTGAANSSHTAKNCKKRPILVYLYGYSNRVPTKIPAI